MPFFTVGLLFLGMSLLRRKSQLPDDSNEIKVIWIYVTSIILKSLLFRRKIIQKWQKINKSIAQDFKGNRTRAAQTRGEHYSRTLKN